jgi:hypothetical protein
MARITRKKANGVTVTDRRKIKSKKITIDEIEFDSLLEGKTYTALRDSKEEFVIKPIYQIIPSFEYASDKIRKMIWTPDFYLPKRNIVLESKGLANESFPLRLKMFMWMHRIENGGMEPKVVIVKNAKELSAFIDSLLINNYKS